VTVRREPDLPTPDGHAAESLQRLLGVKNVAEILGNSPSWVYEKARDGTIRSGMFGKHRRFRPEDIREYIDAQIDA
jgi:excisionase family DNA binding protein